MAKVRQPKSGQESSQTRLESESERAKQRIAALERERDETTNLYKRAIADYRNLEQRVAQERRTAVQWANEILLEKLLPVVDNLEQAVASARKEERESSWFVGITMVLNQFHDILHQEGLTEIPAMGQPFDPKTHEAVDTVYGKPNEIIHVVRKGYFLYDKILRPAIVKVGREEVV